jgi:hypothetical protein
MAKQKKTTLELYDEYKEQIVYDENKKVWGVPSDTTPGVVYETDPIDEVCDCPARTTCWHLRVAELSRAKRDTALQAYVDKKKAESLERKKNQLRIPADRVILSLAKMGV